MKRLHLFFVLLQIHSVLLIAQRVTWESTGGPHGSKVSFIVVNSKGVIFLTTYGDLNSRIYRSSDNGDTWEMLNETYNIWSAHITEKDELLLGSSVGLYQSYDDGQSWIYHRDKLPNYQIQSILRTKNDILLIGSSSGIARSSNNGVFWQNISDSIRSSGEIGYFSVDKILVDLSGIIYLHKMGGTDEWYRSSDDGISWLKIIPGNTLPRIASMTITTQGQLLASTQGGAVYQSIDQGATWQLHPFGLENPNLYTLKYDPTGNLYVQRTSGDYFRSQDSGKTWDLFVPMYLLPTAFVVDNKERLFVGTAKDGILRSTDRGNTWQSFKHYLPFAFVRRMITMNSGAIIVGTDFGLHRLKHSNALWEQLRVPSYQENVWYVTRDTRNNVYVLADQLYYSTNEGETWKTGGTYSGDDNLSIDEQGTLYNTTSHQHASYSIYRSTDYAASWVGLRNIRQVLKLFIFKDDILYAATLNDGILRSSNKGVTWQSISSYTPYETLMTMNSKGELFLCTYDSLISISRSTNDGKDWITVRTNMKKYPSLIEVQPTNALLLSTSHGIYESMDNGDSWNLLSPLINNAYIHAFTFMGDNTIYAGTSTAGVFRSVNSITSLGENRALPASTDYELACNHPNPFSESTTIRFQITDCRLQIPNDQGSEKTDVYNLSSVISLKLYDLFGREVLDLTDRIQSASALTIHRSDLPAPGMYFYRLQSGEQIVTKKMLLLE